MSNRTNRRQIRTTNLERAITEATASFATNLVQILSRAPIAELQSFTETRREGNRRPARRTNTQALPTPKRTRSTFSDRFSNGTNTVDVRKINGKFSVSLNGKTYARADRYQVSSILHRNGYKRVNETSINA